MYNKNIKLTFFNYNLKNVGEDFLKTYRSTQDFCIDKLISERNKIIKESLPEGSKYKEYFLKSIPDNILFYLAIIIYLADTVYNKLGDGFHEEVYQDALEQELLRNHIHYIREKPLVIEYTYNDILSKENDLTIRLQHTYRPDFCIEVPDNNNLIIELKSKYIEKQKNMDSETEEMYESREVKQTLNYMRASGQKYGLILNFYGNAKSNAKIIYNTYIQTK